MRNAPKKVLITGGCGFVGSSLAFQMKKWWPTSEVIALDNLLRKGSELNVERLKKAGIRVMVRDVRKTKNFSDLKGIDLILDCAAEPSVLAGVNSSSLYAVETNIMGTVHCLELAKKTNARIIFISTSRIYPIKELNNIKTTETKTRLELSPRQKMCGVSIHGVNEGFPIGNERTLYGATKLSSEMLIHEYNSIYQIPYIINRCGVIAGPWQFGKVDQGVAVLWLARHYFADKPLSYIGFDGTGKQVRDFLHVDDLATAIKYQIDNFDSLNRSIFNLGGGPSNSVSLLELTKICQKITGHTIEIKSVPETRWGDVKTYISDNSRFEAVSGWRPRKDVETIMRDIFKWINDNPKIFL